MPKATKDSKKEESSKNTTSTKKTTSNTRKRTTSTTKSTSKTTKVKKESVVTYSKKEVKPKSASKKSTTSKRKPNTSKSSSTKKNGTTNNKKTATATSKKKTSTKAKKLDTNIVAEYYDLPYRYNETTVKILYQTPNVLFVYWDISDEDREKFIKQYGENFFYNTKPILKIFNLTKNYNFEVEINDFANSWYINISDAACDYKVDLARKTIKYEEKLNTDYIYVSSSNNIEFPNDHILLENLPNTINFKNVKTNVITTKNINTNTTTNINTSFLI